MKEIISLSVGKLFLLIFLAFLFGNGVGLLVGISSGRVLGIVDGINICEAIKNGNR